MSSIDVSNQITSMQNDTEQYKAATETKTTGSTNVTSDTFLTLMLKELQYQDPMSPMDNKDFLSQQAQMTQLSTTQDMSKNIASNNTIMQSLSLVGKSVTITDPDDSKKTITGTVSQATFDSSGAAIRLNGKDYPITLVKSVADAGTTSSGSTDTSSSSNSSTSNSSSSGSSSSSS